MRRSPRLRWSLLAGALLLRVTVGGKPVLDREIAAGPFQVAEPLSGIRLSGPVLLRLVTPPFVPSQQGAADPRTLGLFFDSICLR